MLNKHEFYEMEIWSDWADKFKNSESKSLFLHGIMGSELYDYNSKDEIWLDCGILHEVDNLEFDKLTPNGSVDSQNQFICARSTVHPPIVEDPYAKFFTRVKSGVFNYDWRESIPIEAKRLHLFLNYLKRLQLIGKTKNEINFITHSMGGCVLLWLLVNTAEFDNHIGKIIFCAPPFHGALKPLRVIEDGNGTPLDWVIRNSVLRQSAVTMPGLFQMLVAPEKYWVTSVNSHRFQYPIRANCSLYNSGAWTNPYRPKLLSTVLKIAERFHNKKWNGIKNVTSRLGDKIYVIAGLNGKTTCSATRLDSGDWILNKVPKPSAGYVSNGDGTVLFQSSFLSGLSKERYWAEIPSDQVNTHGGFMDRQNVIDGINHILNNTHPDCKLHPHDEFIKKIDWSSETENSTNSEINLDYIEQTRLRSITPKIDWDEKSLNAEKDAEVFAMTREAALHVLNGDDMKIAAGRIGQNVEFLDGHLRTLLLPLLFS